MDPKIVESGIAPTWQGCRAGISSWAGWLAALMMAIDAFLMAQCHVMGGSITISGYHEDDT